MRRFDHTDVIFYVQTTKRETCLGAVAGLLAGIRLALGAQARPSTPVAVKHFLTPRTRGRSCLPTSALYGVLVEKSRTIMHDDRLTKRRMGKARSSVGLRIVVVGAGMIQPKFEFLVS